MTREDINQVLEELCKEVPELAYVMLSPDEATAWMDELYSELQKFSGNPLKNLLSLVLRKQAAYRRLEISDRIKVLVPSELKESRVEIHDWYKAEQKDDQMWPRAVILRRDPTQADFSYIPVESIDIIRSVQQDLSAIRHFAIQIAIHRWVNLVRYYYHLPVRSDAEEVERKRGERSQHNWYKMAAHHIKRIGGEAILEEAKKSALPMEVTVLVHNINQLRDQEQYLRVVWNLLRSQEVQSKNTELGLLKALRNGLEAMKDNFPTIICGPLPYDQAGTNSFKILVKKLEIDCQPGKPLPVAARADIIFAFLQSSKGSRFQRSPGKFSSIRCEFNAWYLRRDPDTVNKYLRAAKRKLQRMVIENSFMQARSLQPTLWNSYSLSEFIDWDSPFAWFTPPTVSTKISKVD